MNNVFDLHHKVSQSAGLTSQTIATDTTTVGEIIDTAGFTVLEFLLLSGTITDGAYAVSMTESDDSGMSGETAVSAAETLGDADYALADDDTAKRIGYIGKKRYVRLAIVSTATTSGGVFAGIALLGGPAHQPVAD